VTNACPSCGLTYPVAPQHAGREFACTKCGDTLRVTDAGLESRKAPTHADGGDGAALPAGAARWPRGAPRTMSESSLPDFLTFRRMIVPLIIQVIFWIGTGLSLLTGVLVWIDVTTKQGAPLVGLIAFVVCAALGTLLVRIACELLIVVFRINDALTDIKEILHRERR
jgi:hypothetical protein